MGGVRGQARTVWDGQKIEAGHGEKGEPKKVRVLSLDLVVLVIGDEGRWAVSVPMWHQCSVRLTGGV